MPAASRSSTPASSLTWDTLLGDRPITLKELNERAKIKSSLQKINGQWVEVDTSSLRNALRFLKEAPSGELDSSRALRHLMGSHGVAPGVTVQQGRSSGWVTQLLDTLRQPGSLKDLPTPFHFHGQLRPYQLRGYSWLRFITSFGLGACLADDMGLGKTIQTLALLARLREEHTGQDRLPPTLLICPTSVMGNWEREVERFTPGTRVMLHHGPTRMKGEVLRAAAMQHDLVLTSFTLLTRDTEDLAEIPWLGIVVDEAQNIKNGETKQTRAARALPASFRIALTGTPVENHVGDLYSLMEFLNPGLLGTTREFQGRFLKPIQNFGNKEAALSLKRITSPFVLRRLKTDKSILSDLPEKFETKTYCKLTKEQGRLYQEIVAGGLQSLDGASAMQRRAHILTTIMRLKQVCDHPALVLRDEAGTAVALEGQSGKLERLTELLTEVRESGEKALVFSQFAEMGHLLQSYLEVTLKQKILFLHGGTPRLQREELIEEFSTPEGPGIFVLSLKAGGTGLNLVAANHVFHFDRWWNPAVENQATDRAFRIGQTKGVQVHKFICKGTLEERIDQMIEQKRELAEQVVQAGETWLTEMSTQELRNLFSLSQEAMED